MDKRVVIFLESMALGGLQRVAIDHAEFLIAKGYSVQMVALKSGGALASSIDSRVEYLDLKAEKLRNVIFASNKEIWVGRNVRYICHQPQIFVSLLIWFLRFSASALFTRVFTMLHSNYRVWTLPRTNGYLQLAITLLFNARVFVPSQAAIAKLCQWFPLQNKQKCVYLPNTIRQIFHPKENIKSPEKTIFVFVGRLSPAKNLNFLLATLGTLSDRNDWHLDIYGDGEDEKRLKKQAHDLQINDKLTFHGTSFDLDEIYVGKNAMILPSESEGFGNCVIEAMAYGVLPIINDASIATVEIINGGKLGYIYEVSNKESLRDKLLQAMQGSIAIDQTDLRKRASDFEFEKVLKSLLLCIN